MNIIAISGQAQSGKDTSADRLVDKHGFVKESFAGPIKNFGKEIFEFTDLQLWGPSKNRDKIDERYFELSDQWVMAGNNLIKKKREWLKNVATEEQFKQAELSLVKWFLWLHRTHSSLSPRIALQTLGTEWGRDSVDKDIWVNSLFMRARNLIQNGAAGVVISDTRYENELDAVITNGGKVIRLERPETDRKAMSAGISNHPSEKEQTTINPDKFDVIISNIGTIEELYKKLDDFIISLDN